MRQAKRREKEMRHKENKGREGKVEKRLGGEEL